MTVVARVGHVDPWFFFTAVRAANGIYTAVGGRAIFSSQRANAWIALVFDSIAVTGVAGDFRTTATRIANALLYRPIKASPRLETGVRPSSGEKIFGTTSLS